MMQQYNDSDLQQLFAQLDNQTGTPYQIAILRPLVICIVLLSGLSFLTTIARGSTLRSTAVVVLSLLINLAVLWLIRNGRVKIASHSFSLFLNLAIFALMSFNLQTGTFDVALVFASQLAMPILLVGVLLSPRATFAYAIVNALLMGSAFYLFFSWARGMSFSPDSLFRLNLDVDASPLFVAFSFALPIGFYLIFIAVVAWLYRRALDRSAEGLRIARDRILRDEIMRRDIALARKMQQRMLPPLPLWQGMQVQAFAQPARETSGDFYDFIELPEGRYGIAIGDVEGKSIAAALGTAMARSILVTEARRYTSAAEALNGINHVLLEHPSLRQTLTLCYVIIDPVAGKLHCSCAGHPAPYLLRAGEVVELELMGFPLGIRADATYQEWQAPIHDGDTLVLITDGAIEEMNSERIIFGFDRMAQILRRYAKEPLAQLQTKLFADLEAYRGKSEQSDDITMVFARFGANAQPTSSD